MLSVSTCLFAVLTLGFSHGVLSTQSPRLHVGGDIKRPIKIRTVPPVYPKEALDNKIGGTVLLEIVIGTEGSVLEQKVVQSVHPLLDAAAAEAVRQWKYVPTKRQRSDGGSDHDR